MKAIFITLLLQFLLLSTAYTQVYVAADATGANDGTSWADAFTDLQSGINAANSTTDVWVKAGVYKPTTGTDRSAQFILSNGASVYGGFGGTETMLSQRDHDANQTILSGEIGDPNLLTDNITNIIKVTSNNINTVFSGFSIMKTYDNNVGDGIIGLVNASLTIDNCVFENNLGTQVRALGAVVNVYNCSFLNNTGTAIHGFGSNATMKIVNCEIYNNNGLGGKFDDGTFEIINNTFYGNIAGITIFFPQSALVYNNILWNNGGNEASIFGSVTSTNNIIEGTILAGNFDLNPGFLDEVNGNLSLKSCSQARNLGNNSFLSTAFTEDIAGNPRIFDTTIDVGAYELQSFPIQINTFETLDIACFGAATGQISVGAVGGTGSLEFSTDGSNFTASPVLTNLASGAYTVTVKDSGGCTDTGMVSVVELASSVLTFSNSKVDIVCAGESTGELTILATGGVTPYNYSVDGVNFQVSNHFTNLAAGSYSAMVKDAVGCQTTASVSILEPNPIVLNSTIIPVSCNGGADGSILVSATGGTGGYVYSINSGTFDPSTTFLNLSKATYTIAVKDGAGCISSFQIDMTEPDALVLTTTVSDISCNGLVDGNIGVSASGGTTTYEYSIDGVNFSPVTSFDNLAAGNYTITLKDANGCETNEQVSIAEPAALSATINKTDANCNGADDGVISFTTSGGTGTVEASIDGINFQTGDLTGLAPSNYTVTFKDENNCTIFINTTITEPTTISTSVATTDLTCAGSQSGKIVITASGGNAPLEYSIDGTNFQSSAAFSSLEGGSYTITTKDANSCTATDNVTLTETDVLVLSITTTNISCNGDVTGGINSVASGGTSPYEYSLDGINFSSSANFTSLGAGSYTITLRDANECEITKDITLTEPEALMLTAQSTAILCNGEATGEVTLTGSGGTTPYEYSINGTSFQSGVEFTGLAAADYILTIKDANGCTTTATATVIEPEELDVMAFFDGTNVDLTATGGNSPYTYSSDDTNFQSEASFTLPNGNYTFTVQDDNGCEATTNEDLVITALDILNETEQVNLYPNPTIGELHLNGLQVNSHIFLIDRLGRKVLHQKVNANEASLDLSNLKQGIYIVLMVSNYGETKQFKLRKNN